MKSTKYALQYCILCGYYITSDVSIRQYGHYVVCMRDVVLFELIPRSGECFDNIDIFVEISPIEESSEEQAAADTQLQRR